MRLRKIIDSVTAAFHHTNRHARREKLASQPVYIMDTDQLYNLAEKNPFNANLFKEHYKRDKNFPGFLFLGNTKATYFIICNEDGQFIASATLRYKSKEVTSVSLSQVSVHPEYRDSGLATRLIKSVANFLNTECPDIKEVHLSSYEEMGKIYLRKKFHELAKEFDANLVEQSIEFFSVPTVIPK